MPKPLTFLLRASVSPKSRQSSDFYPSQKPRKTKESPVSEAETPRNSKNPQISIARERPKPQTRSFSQILHRIERFEIASNSRTNSILSLISLSLSVVDAVAGEREEIKDHMLRRRNVQLQVYLYGRDEWQYSK